MTRMGWDGVETRWGGLGRIEAKGMSWYAIVRHRIMVRIVIWNLFIDLTIQSPLYYTNNSDV